MMLPNHKKPPHKLNVTTMTIGNDAGAASTMMKDRNNSGNNHKRGGSPIQRRSTNTSTNSAHLCNVLTLLLGVGLGIGLSQLLSRRQGQEDDALLRTGSARMDQSDLVTTIETTTTTTTPPGQRSYSFPTVEERVRYYMGSWYDYDQPTTTWHGDCSQFPYFSSARRGLNFNQDRSSDIHDATMDHPYLFDRHNLQLALETAPSSRKRALYHGELLQHYFNHSDTPQQEHMSSREDNRRIIAMFGDRMAPLIRQDQKDGNLDDEETSFFFPVMVKARRVPPQNLNQKSFVQPILASFATDRHFTRYLDRIQNVPPIAWEQKQNTVIWRGSSSSHDNYRFGIVQQYATYDKTDIDIAFSQLTGRHSQKDGDAFQNLVGNKLEPRQLLQYKYLLSLEGNDVATSLKWMLYAQNSVVFLPFPPTAASWAMEDFALQPFYHFIPLTRNASNLPQMLEWARTHDAQCQLIARQSTEYMERLWVSQQAKRDNREIRRRIVQRYDRQFGKALAQCPTSLQ